MYQQLLIVLALLVLGYTIGSWRERRHLKSLRQREAGLADIAVSNLKAVPNADTVRQSQLVTGEAVIATDYFKTFGASLRNIVGGEIRTFETLMSRARREASLRMLEQARQCGATEVWNVRFGFSSISLMAAFKRCGLPGVSALRNSGYSSVTLPHASSSPSPQGPSVCSRSRIS